MPACLFHVQLYSGVGNSWMIMPASLIHVQLYSRGFGNSPHLSRNSSRPPHNGSWLHADVHLNRFHFDPPLKTFQRGSVQKKIALLCSVFGDGIVQERKGSSLNEDTLSWSSTLPESHLCGRLKPHSGEKLLCEEVNDLLHFSALCINSSVAISEI